MISTAIKRRLLVLPFIIHFCHNLNVTAESYLLPSSIDARGSIQYFLEYNKCLLKLKQPIAKSSLEN